MLYLVLKKITNKKYYSTEPRLKITLKVIVKTFALYVFKYNKKYKTEL